jgi:prepilin-type N-terminal cleavage/methylation domain-containing protein
MKISAGKRRGFTLVEVLVVLVISGLAITILMQALSQVYRLQGRFDRALVASQGQAMRADWFRQAIQALEPDFAAGAHVFRGDASGLQAMSNDLPSSAPEGPRTFSITILDAPEVGAGARSVVLRPAGGEPLTLFSQPADAIVAFGYLDDSGREHDAWPPREIGTWDQLPSAVILRWRSERQSNVWVAAPRGDRQARLKPLRLLGPS